MKWSEITCPERADFYGEYNENEMMVRGWFLYSIGIDLEHLPEELFESCEIISVENMRLSDPHEEKVHISDIVGTTHTVYGGRTWIYAFIQEHKVLSHIKAGNVTRGKYFRMMKRPPNKQLVPIKLVKAKEGQYYIYGSGNHRITFYKLMYLADLATNKYGLNKYWLFADVYDEL